MLVREGGNLRQVGDHQNLHVSGEHGEAATDFDSCLTAHTGVHLVEDEGGYGVHFGKHYFQGEHHAGELTAGGALTERARHGGSVRGQHEGHGVSTVHRELFSFGNLHDQGGVRHGKSSKLLTDGIRQFLRGGTAQGGQLFCLGAEHLT